MLRVAGWLNEQTGEWYGAVSGQGRRNASVPACRSEDGAAAHHDGVVQPRSGHGSVGEPAGGNVGYNRRRRSACRRVERCTAFGTRHD